MAGKNGMVRDDELILKRPNMPAPEEVSDDRERQFEEEEKRVVRRGEDQDPDYVQ